MSPGLETFANAVDRLVEERLAPTVPYEYAAGARIWESDACSVQMRQDDGNVAVLVGHRPHLFAAPYPRQPLERVDPKVIADTVVQHLSAADFAKPDVFSEKRDESQIQSDMSDGADCAAEIPSPVNEAAQLTQDIISKSHVPVDASGRAFLLHCIAQLSADEVRDSDADIVNSGISLLKTVHVYENSRSEAPVPVEASHILIWGRPWPWNPRSNFDPPSFA